MTHIILPAVWLIVFIAGLPLLSETVYTPSLPEIAQALHASESMVEYTLTIYLFGFAIGTLFWGKLSDKFGRKPCVLAGLVIFTLGCVGCYFSSSITTLMISRLIQAFGGSIGSVLGQAICRDAFQGPALGRMYSTTGSALSIFPAIGPVVGGFIAENFGWPSIFLFLIAVSMVLSIAVAQKLPETHHIENRKSNSIAAVALSLIKNQKIIGFGLLVAACNGLSFSYYAEGSFYLIEQLGLTPSEYGLSFIAIAASAMLGGMLSRKLHASHDSKTILHIGLKIIFVATSVFTALVVWHSMISALPLAAMISITIVAQMGIMFGVCMTTSNALSMALVDYKWCVGTASSLFGCFYYCLIAVFTFGMGALHNGTLLPMPLYFLGVSIFMLMVQQFLLRD